MSNMQLDKLVNDLGLEIIYFEVPRVVKRTIIDRVFSRGSVHEYTVTEYVPRPHVVLRATEVWTVEQTEQAIAVGRVCRCHDCICCAAAYEHRRK